MNIGSTYDIKRVFRSCMVVRPFSRNELIIATRCRFFALAFWSSLQTPFWGRTRNLDISFPFPKNIFSFLSSSKHCLANFIPTEPAIMAAKSSANRWLEQQPRNSLRSLWKVMKSRGVTVGRVGHLFWWEMCASFYPFFNEDSPIGKPIFKPNRIRFQNAETPQFTDAP